MENDYLMWFVWIDGFLVCDGDFVWWLFVWIVVVEGIWFDGDVWCELYGDVWGVVYVDVEGVGWIVVEGWYVCVVVLCVEFVWCWFVWLVCVCCVVVCVCVEVVGDVWDDWVVCGCVGCVYLYVWSVWCDWWCGVGDGCCV